MVQMGSIGKTDNFARAVWRAASVGVAVHVGLGLAVGVSVEVGMGLTMGWRCCSGWCNRYAVYFSNAVAVYCLLVIRFYGVLMEPGLPSRVRADGELFSARQGCLRQGRGSYRYRYRA